MTARPASAVSRRCLTLGAVLCACAPRLTFAGAPEAGQHWMAAAEAMRQLALSWGDQSYGAVLVKDGRIIGEGPSRVVKNKDPDAHAEREAIRHALAAVGPQGVQGAVLYSTSRPCRRCEGAAAGAGVARMYFGPQVQDAGPPGGT